MNLRKTLVIRETIEVDETNKSCSPVTRVAGLAVVANPFAGRFVEDLSSLFDLGRDIGELLMPQMVAQLSSPAVSYGKAAIVGIDGSMEQGGAGPHLRLLMIGSRTRFMSRLVHSMMRRSCRQSSIFGARTAYRGLRPQTLCHVTYSSGQMT